MSTRLTVAKSDLSSTVGQVVGVLLAATILIPGLVWIASNYVATSPYLQGFAFRDLAAVGTALFALTRYFRD